AEVAGRIAFIVLDRDVRTPQQGSVVLGQQHPRARPRDVLPQYRGVDALALEQVGLGGPAGPAGLSPIGAGDQRDERRDVGQAGIAEAGPDHAANSCRTFTSASAKASISSKVL